MIRGDVERLVYRAHLEPWNFSLFSSLFEGYLDMVRRYKDVELLRWMYVKRRELFSLKTEENNVRVFSRSSSGDLSGEVKATEEI